MKPTVRNDLESNAISHLNIDRNIDTLNKIALELYVERYVLMYL